MITVGVLATARPRNGGTLNYTKSMLQALALEDGMGLHVVVYTQPDNTEFDGAGLRVTHAPGAIGLLIARIFGKNPYAEVDVVLAPGYCPPRYSTSLPLCGRPFAFTLHDVQERYYPQYFSLVTRLWRRISNRLLSWYASKIVCESRWVKRDIMRCLGVPETRVCVVPGPPMTTINGAVSDREKETIRGKYRLPDVFAFYPAQFWLHKNHSRLLEAFAQVLKANPDVGLVLTGARQLEYDAVIRRAETLGIRDKVFDVGNVSIPELNALYALASIVVIPTLFESISIPVYEAFASGRPVCVSNVVALPEQVGEAGLLFDPLVVADIAAQMGRLLSDDQLRQTLVARGYARLNAVTMESYSGQLLELLNAARGCG